MLFNFKIGDKILILNDNLKATIMNINNNNIKVRLDDSGILTNVLKSEIMLLSNYRNMTDINYKNDKSDKKIQIIKDLHKDKILKKNQKLSISEVLRKQILIIHLTIEEAINLDNEVIEIIFIHGTGSGRLRDELHHLLKDKGLKYKEIQNGVATEVLI